jgi:hypothetical protein
VEGTTELWPIDQGSIGERRMGVTGRLKWGGDDRFRQGGDKLGVALVAGGHEVCCRPVRPTGVGDVGRQS